MRKIISLICLLMPLMAAADELQLREDAPDKYVVVKGDTLWDISAKFFKSPWRWTEIWGLNKDTIKDPHWIYPGDVVYLDPNSKTLLVNQAPSTTSSDAPSEQAAINPDEIPSVDDSDAVRIDPNAIRYSPKARILPGRSDAIPVISLSVIGPFLKRPLVIEEDELELAPRLIGTVEHKELLGDGDTAYGQGISEEKGKRWQIYRPTISFFDPETKELLGHEVIYLGDAYVEKFSDISTLTITKSILEIEKGDYFAQAETGFATNYVPRAPSSEINAQIISIYGGITQGGQHSVVTLNRGQRDGVEQGHVLAVYQKGDVVKNKNWFKRNITLPPVKNGLLFVFRVFEKVSYALVLESKQPVQVLDKVSNPE